jgi:biotin carboxyl carrier protein
MSSRGQAIEPAPRRIVWRGPAHGTVEAGGRQKPFTTAAVGGAVWVRLGGRTYVVSGSAVRSVQAPGAGSSSRQPASPMPGIVLSIAAVEGERVARGDILVTIEAMKVEHEVRAAEDAVVAQLHVKVGQRVEAGTRLCTLRDADGGPS